MKILIDARFYGLENAGLGRYTINLLDRLQAIDSANSYFVLLRKKYFERANFKPNFQKVLADTSHYSVREQLEIPKIIKKYNPDLTHFLNPNMPIGFNGKFVVTIHDMITYKTNWKSTTLPVPIYYAKNLVYKKVFSHALKKAEKVIVPSQFVKDELIKSFKIGNIKVKVVYEGVSVLDSHLKTRSFGPHKGVASHSFLTDAHIDSLYFLYVGNAYPHKNLERAVKAFSALNKITNQKICFYIVAKKNAFTDKLNKLVSKLGAQEFVKFLGNVSDENLKELYEKSVGFIYPSLSEGFGLQGLEAMQAGTILLSSDIPVFREIYGGSAIYFNPTEIESIEKAIKKALSLDKFEANKIIKRNREFARKYSWDKMAKETLQIYKECYN